MHADVRPRASSGALPDLANHLRSLRALSAVARHGSSLRAAEVLHLSQPAVARAVLELERGCGLSFFHRGTRGMAPTPLGAQLAARAQTLFLHLTQGAADTMAIAGKSARMLAAPERFPAVVRPMQLRALLAIAAHGAEAAASIGVSPPALHAAFHSLEQLFGQRLGCKLPTGTQLTVAGEALLRRVKLAAAEMAAMELDIAAWRGEMRGHIVVGVLPLSVPMFLPRAVETLLARLPQVEVQIVDGTYESLLRQLLNADIDVLAGALRAGLAPDDLRQTHLFNDDLVVIAPDHHPCLRQPEITLADLLAHEWVAPLPGTPAALAMSDAFESQGLEVPRHCIHASSPSLTIAFVKQTGRLAIASRGQTLLDDHRGQLKIVPLALPMTSRPIGVVTRAVGEPSQDVQMFLDACRSAADETRALVGQ